MHKGIQIECVQYALGSMRVCVCECVVLIGKEQELLLCLC